MKQVMVYEFQSCQKNLHQRRLDHLYIVFGRNGSAVEHDYNMNPSSVLKIQQGQ